MINIWFAYIQYPVQNYFDMAHPAHMQAHNIFWISTLTLKVFSSLTILPNKIIFYQLE